MASYTFNGRLSYYYESGAPTIIERDTFDGTPNIIGAFAPAADHANVDLTFFVATEVAPVAKTKRVLGTAYSPNADREITAYQVVTDSHGFFTITLTDALSFTIMPGKWIRNTSDDPTAAQFSSSGDPTLHYSRGYFILAPTYTFAPEFLNSSGQFFDVGAGIYYQSGVLNQVSTELPLGSLYSQPYALFPTGVSGILPTIGDDSAGTNGDNLSISSRYYSVSNTDVEYAPGVWSWGMGPLRYFGVSRNEAYKPTYPGAYSKLSGTTTAWLVLKAREDGSRPSQPPAAVANAYNYGHKTGLYMKTGVGTTVGSAFNSVQFLRPDFATPQGGYTVQSTVTNSPGTFADPRCVMNYQERIFVCYAQQTGIIADNTWDVLEAYSDDYGDTWSNPTVSIAGGKRPTIVSDLAGTILRAAYVETDGVAHTGVIKATVQQAGDATASAVFTFKDSAGADIAVPDDSFQIAPAYEGAGRWVLTCTRSGASSDWYSGDDARTWVLIS